MKERIERLAARLGGAWESRIPLDPLHETDPDVGVAEAYQIQQAWVAGRLKAGDRIVGRKIGLTSRAMQEQLGVDEPDFGTLLESLRLPTEADIARAAADRFIQPKVEGEIAFLLAEPVAGPHATVLDVFRATAAVAAAVEVIDSRIRDWRIRLQDTVADNASCGAFALGAWNTRWRLLDLSATGMALYVDGRLAAAGSGAAALGHPAACVAWLANKLAEAGDRLEPGDVVLSGSLGPAVSVAPGSRVRLEIDGCEAISVAFET